jgi:hypothetical protein
MPAADVQSHPQRRPSHGGADQVLDMISYGVPFRLTAESPEMLERMRRQAPYGSAPCLAAPSGGRNFSLRAAPSGATYQVLADGKLLVDGAAMAPALVQLGGQLTIHVAEYAPDFVFVHAGVVAWQGRALLLPGVSHAGKSTLVAELVRAGATYYSDEFALLDSQGRVHPFARDLRIRQPGKPDQTSVPLTQLSGRAGTGALTVSMVVFAEYAENACWAPEPLSQGRAVLEMLLHTVPVQRTPARVLATVSATVKNAAVRKTLRGEAVPAAHALIAALSAGGAPA